MTDVAEWNDDGPFAVLDAIGAIARMILSEAFSKQAQSNE